MYYKVFFGDDALTVDDVAELKEELQNIASAGGNIVESDPWVFMQSGKELFKLQGTWHKARPESRDVEELSRNHPGLTVFLQHVTDVMNERHFDQLSNYSLTEIVDGHALRILQPEPIQWKSVYEYSRRRKSPFKD